MAHNVRVIPPTIRVTANTQSALAETRKVAGYARVSTGQDEQQSSYEAQVKYYTSYIQSREDWQFAGIYTDEGISATSTRNRSGFREMIADALAGKIDLIITKSVSRFARNTVDSLTTIRQLKEHGTEVYFEKENIWTFDAKGELLLTIMSSIAQEESRSISENVRWGVRKKFSDGEFSLNYSHFLGYDRGEDGGLVINPEQAQVVRKIYTLFLTGDSPYKIAKRLTEEGIPTPGGKTQWYESTVKRILSNETYKGDKLLQKTYSVDFLSKQRRRNVGQVQQYYVEGSHEPIIAPETFDRVQDELARRKNARRSGGYRLSSKIYCGECGGMYGPKVWHSGSKYRKVVWQCNAKYKGPKTCRTPYVTETEIQEALCRVVSALRDGSDAPDPFDSTLWDRLVDHVTVYQKDDIRFTLSTGLEIKA